MTIVKRLEILAERFERLRRKVSKQLKSLPKSKLIYSEYKGNRYYTSIKDGERIYLGRDDNQKVCSIKRRHALEMMNTRCCGNIKLIKDFLNKYKPCNLAAIEADMPKAYQGLPEEMISDYGFIDEKQWNDEEVDKYLYHEENLVHKSLTGIMMRSKGEVICGNIYTSMKTEYKYEKELIFPDGTTIHPDFTILSKTRKKELYHEHCGMMDITDYRDSFIWKMKQYVDHGYIPGRDVLFTFDNNGNADAEEIEKAIENFLELNG